MRMMNIKQDTHDQDPMMTANVEDGMGAGISGVNNSSTIASSTTEPRPPTLQVEHPTYSDNYVIDGQQMISEQRMREILVELQQTWLKEYKQNREKLLVELTEKLHQEYISDLQRKQTEYMAQYREEMETERQRQEELFQRRLQDEIQRLSEKHRRELQMVKKKQWCWQCEQEAIYHCCWNTAYCSVECQQTHWPMHRRYCRRKKASQTASTLTQQQTHNNTGGTNTQQNGELQQQNSNGTSNAR
ncbi:MYND-type domain-containing protein [Meloidogyne graminicola]|uniref:MYND-type domain-containing protein n=1 Tax=Meloidogyne graminicola TaxID=189291 RepID=A0A8S9ZY42_9BILA|nr:MYND-type domain-containing protein [Meloidogyne graminicola]